MPPLPLPARWQNLPVTPAQIRWRVLRGTEPVRPWHTPINFSNGLLPQSTFPWIYAPGTRQNRPGELGLYRFYLAHTWTTTLLPDDAYHLEVEASDLANNKGSRQLPFTLANNL